MKFVLETGIDCFPSDNYLDSLPRRERIAIKKTLKESAQIYTLAWCAKNKIKPKFLSKKHPLFNSPVRTILTIYLRTGKTLDVHNLSIKSFLDQIVSMGIVADDSVKEIPEAVARFGGFIARRSYAEFEIEEISYESPF